MPQISSQATRQAILVDDSTFDSQHPPDKLALFGADGTILNADTLRGNDGAQGPPGIPGINWRGLYSLDADYVVNDGVFHNGSSWRALIPMIHPAAEPSESGALAQLPFFAPDFWPPMSVGVPNTVIIPDDQTAQWLYLDLLSGGDLTFAWDSDAPIFTAPYDNQGNNRGVGIDPPNPFTVTLPAGRYWIDFQDRNTQSTPNTVNMTVTLSNGAAAAPGLPWALVAAKGADGVDGAPGVNGTDGADGGPVPVGGTTGQLLAKVSDVDGDVVWEDPPTGTGGSSSGGGWVIAQSDPQIAIPVTPQKIGPPLVVTAGPSGLVLVHAAVDAANPPGSSTLDFRIDNTPICTSAFGNASPATASLGFSNQSLTLLQPGPTIYAFPGVMLHLTPGDHELSFGVSSSSAGGIAQKFRLAAQAL